MFIVEDGSGVPGANSYTPLDFALAYFADRNRQAEFEGSVEEQQGWLVQATDYVERWRDRFKSTPLFPSQPLSFPRLAYDNVAWMPDQLLRAVCEYAVHAKNGPLAPTPKVDPTGHSVVMTSRKVGPIERGFAVVPGSRVQTLRSYPAADSLLAVLLRPANRRVIR